MKPVAIFLLLAFIVALITEPSHIQFNKYLMKKGKAGGTCLGGTRYTSYKVFSVNYVDYCDEHTVNNSSIGQKTREDKYVGIFGMFWKL